MKYFFSSSIALSIVILCVSWFLSQTYFKNTEDRPHVHAEISDPTKNLPELAPEEIRKINTYAGLIEQNKESKDEILKREMDLTEKIKEKEEKEREIQKREAARKAAAIRKAARPKRVGIPGPIHAKTRNTPNGRVCIKNDDSPSKSGQNKKGHVDTECCLDPDETPNSNCYYPPEMYGKLIERYLNKK